MTEPLSFRQVGLAALEFPCEMLLLGHIHCGANEALEDSLIETWNTNPPYISKLAVWSKDALFNIATWTLQQHVFYQYGHGLTVLRVNACEKFVECGGPICRIETVNLKQFRRPIVKKTRRVEIPASYVSKSLPFGKIELTSLLGALSCDKNAVCILQCNRSEQFVLVIPRRHWCSPICFAASAVP